MVRMSEEEYDRLMKKREALKNKREKESKPQKIAHDFKKKNKFNAVKTKRGEFNFDSGKEAKRYDTLLSLQESGEVIFFLRQCPFHLPGNVTYRVDFLVFWADGHVSVEDVKGILTPQFIDKKKIVESLYPVEVEIL